MTSPPPPPVVEEEEEGQPEQTSAGADAMFLFEKRYDALQNPPRLSNELNGTCQRGQLLLRGYDQELANGQHLRNAYAFYGQQGDDQGAAVDKRMRLFDLTDMNPKDGLPYAEPNLRFRADDDQRTLMSGQVLLRGLFGEEFAKHSETMGEDPIIPLHTADRSRDVLGLEQHMCPRLNDLGTQAEQSKEFQSLNNSLEAITIRTMMERELGGDFLDAAIDCLMTVICTDRPLPDILNDYNGISVPSSQGESRASSSSSDSSDNGNHNYGDNLFDRVAVLSNALDTFRSTFNDGAYAKLAMGPLWAEILNVIQPVVDGNKNATKLNLISGHDTTIFPLLVSLGANMWDNVWPPYASMLILEIHEMQGDGPTHMFRIIYNGRVFTPRMHGCPAESELCPIDVLMTQMKESASLINDCDSLAEDEEASVLLTTVQDSKLLISNAGGMFLLFGIVLLSSLMGGLVVFVSLTHRLPFQKLKTSTPLEMRRTHNVLHLTDPHDDETTLT